jgi:hypothetical protein
LLFDLGLRWLGGKCRFEAVDGFGLVAEDIEEQRGRFQPELGSQLRIRLASGPLSLGGVPAGIADPLCCAAAGGTLVSPHWRPPHPVAIANPTVTTHAAQRFRPNNPAIGS